MSDPDSRYDRQGDEPPLSFDRRRARRSRGPTPVTLIVSLLILLVVGGGVAFMYRAGARGPSQGPQPLGAPLNDVRAPAPVEQPTPDPAAGLTISKDDPNAATAVTPAPAPEEPVPPPAAPAQSAQSPPQPSPVAAPPPPPPTAQSVPGGPPSMAGRQPLPAAPHGKAKSIDTLLAESESRPVAPVRKAPPIVRPAPDHGDGPVVVQIGAFSSERLADQEWSRAASVAPGSMAGKGKRVVAVPTDNGTLYRTSITGFSSREKALALCDQLKAAGGRCFVH